MSLTCIEPRIDLQKPAAIFRNEDLIAHTRLAPDIEPALAAASIHALEGEGSFSRANLAMRVSAALGLSPSQAEKTGASIELFHLASLVLDDLPCMDDALLRRARPCAHVSHGESSAILASLGFINRAYFLLWCLFSGIDQDSQQEAFSLVEECLGFAGILDGQAKDIRFGEDRRSAADVLEIARKKTGSLLRLCVVLPAVLAGSDKFLRNHLERLAELWGMIYQITDDLKDIFHGESMSGKTPGRDEVLGRPNLALKIGTEATMDVLAQFIREAGKELNQLEKANPELRQVLSAFQQKLSTAVKELMDAHVAA